MHVVLIPDKTWSSFQTK